MTRPLARATLAVTIALSILVTAAPSATAANTTHSGPNWSWAGPASWDAGYGVYGITVLGDDGATLDLGFSSTLCANGATWQKSAKHYFKAVRKQLRQGGWQLRAGKIKHPAGFSSLYRRQVLKGNHGQGTKGEITLDYDYTTTVDGLSYCYQRSLAKYADANQWKGLRGTLTQVQNSLAYFGPGAPEGEDPGDF